MKIIEKINNLPITKEQFIEGTLKFINSYKRLPYLQEDDVEVEIENKDGELEFRPFRAGKYVKEFYDNQDNMSEELFKENIITYKLIGEILGITETVVKNAITKETTVPEPRVRRLIHIFFNRDYYTELGIYAKRCEDCEECSCKHEYFVSVISCPRYKKKTEKKPKVKIKKETKVKAKKN